MNKEIRGICFEIIFMSLILIATIPVFVFGSTDKSLERSNLQGYNNKINIELVQNSNITELSPMSDEDALNKMDGQVIKISNMDDKKASYDFVLKMNKIENLENYKIMFNGKVSCLSDLTYTEDMENRYFTLDNFNGSNKDRYVTFLLWISDDAENIISEDITYSFMMERNLYGL